MKDIISNATAAEATQSTNNNLKTPLLVVGSFGCGFFLCALLTLSLGFLLVDTNQVAQLINPPATSITAKITPMSTITMTDTAIPATETSAPAPTLEPSPSSTPLLTNTPARPKLEAITFALDATAEDYTPINPGISFIEGITEVHAIFDYQGMTKTDDWIRVWYHDEVEILRSEATWSGEEEGRFDYFIDAGGNPLPAGGWLLELYINSQLMVSGTFTIGSPPTPTPMPTSTGIASVQVTSIAIPPTTTPTITPTTSQTVRKLAYTVWNGVQNNLYVADTNGLGIKFLLNRASGPSWTPDGQQLFFYGEEGVDRQELQNGGVYLFNHLSNGIIAMTNAAALPDTPDLALYQDITWKQGSARWANVSPNGKMVAFDAHIGDAPYRIFFLGTNDNQQYQYQILGEQADWSPDSQQLVYRSGRDSMTGLWVSNRDDTGHRLLTNNSTDSFPAWSPDGKTIAFSRDNDNNVDIYTIQVDGTNLRRLTDSPGPDTLPVYTPDGDIIFRSTRSGQWGIWQMDSNGKVAHEIISNAPVGPDWSYSRMDIH